MYPIVMIIGRLSPPQYLLSEHEKWLFLLSLHLNNVWMMKIIFIPFGIENMEWHKSNTWTLKELTYAS